MNVHIRWMIRRDTPEVMAIEQAGFGRPKTEEEILAMLRRRNCIGMVAEQGERVVGFMIYELHKTSVRILDFAVHPDRRRMGAGAQMAAKLAGKLSSHRRTRLAIHVRETNLAAQLFFASQGFRAVDVLREHFDDTEEDAYAMVYAIEQAAPAMLDAPRW